MINPVNYDIWTVLGQCLPGVVATSEIEDMVTMVLSDENYDPNSPMPPSLCDKVRARVLPLFPVIGNPPEYTLGPPFEPHTRTYDTLGVDAGGGDILGTGPGDILVIGLSEFGPTGPPTMPGASPLLIDALPDQPGLHSPDEFIGIPRPPVATVDILGVGGGDVLGVNAAGDVLGVGTLTVQPSDPISMFPWGLPRFQDSNPTPLDNWSIDHPSAVP